MDSLRSLSVFGGKVKLTKEEKIEYGLIVLTGLIIAGVSMYFCPPAYAVISNTEIASLIKTIVKAICYIVGALFAIVGIVKFAISHANEDGPAQQKAIMMIATGLLLVVLGTTLVRLIKADWFKVD